MRENHELFDSDKSPENIIPDIISIPVEDLSTLEKIRLVDKSRRVEMGDCIQIKKDDRRSFAAYGVYHSVSGIIKTNDDKTHVFSSFPDMFTKKQKKIMEKSVGGIVGGGRTALNSLSDKLKDANVQIIESPGKYRDFNLVVIQDRDDLSENPVLCYHYGDIEELCTRSKGAKALNLCMDEVTPN